MSLDRSPLFRTLAPLCVMCGITACAAPAAERATGAVAEAVERSLEAGTATFDHDEWDALLRDGTSDGLVDYRFMGANRARLDAYALRLAAADLGSLQRDELKALLINAYNALTVIAILDHSGVASIRDIDGVWTDLQWEVGGHSLTLDNIEHNLLRAFFRDPRIHFVVNCASHSCAPLPGWAYRGADLEKQLEERSRAFLTDPRNVALVDGELRVSRYFDWYGSDFTEPDWAPRAESIPAFIALYATEEVRSVVSANPDVSIAYIEYDWTLNDLGASRTSSLIDSSPVAAAVLAQESIGRVARAVVWLREWVDGFGVWGPVLYGLAYVLATVLAIPGSAVTIGAGVAFGLGLGTVTVFLGANIGAALAFLIGRYLLRSRIQRWLAGRQKLSAIDRAVESQGWRVVALTRLSPVLPFNVQNYFYGLTGVALGAYVAASLVGMLPGTLLYVYIGAAGAEVAEAAGGAANWGRTALLVAGLAATLWVVVLVTRVAKRELDKALTEAAPEPEPA